MPNERRAPGGWLVAVLVTIAGALAPSTASAAAPITFSYSAGSRCVAGTKPPTGRITLRLVAPNGTLRDVSTSPAASASLGGYEVCFSVTPRPGDRIRGIRGSTQRTVTLPILTIAVNRVADVVSGKGPIGRRLAIAARHCTLTIECEDQVERTATVGRDGRYRKDLRSAVDLRGMDRVSASYETSAGDSFQAHTNVPFFQVGPPDRVAAYCASGTRVVRLRRADGRERARATFRAPHRCRSDILASLAKRFLRDGEAVTPSTGNILRSDIASDARMVWPGPSLGIGNGSMTGKCLPNAPYGVYLQRPDEGGTSYTLAEGTTSPEGLFQRAAGMTLLAGDRIRMICATPAGDHLVLDQVAD